ncbi:MAG: hypothetical protein JNL43_00455 [Flavobacteriales bacterium]|nr:hypothetical protein [Flavobacteriales bacterium]
MSLRSYLLALSIPFTPLIGLSQTPTAVDVIKDMVAYVKTPSPVNPTCSFHAVNTTVNVVDKNLCYSGANKLFSGTSVAVVMGSKMPYNTLVTTKVPLKMQEFTAGTNTPVANGGEVFFGWAGTNSAVLGTITLDLKGQKKVYSIPSSMNVMTLAKGNKYILSGTLADGSMVTIYLEKGAFSDCK